MVVKAVFSEREKLAAIRAHQLSGQTANSFCRERGIAPSSFCAWRQNLAASGKPGRQIEPSNKRRGRDVGAEFLPVTLLDSKLTSATAPTPACLQSTGTVAMEIRMPSGCLIRLASNCPSSFLDAALAATVVQ